MVDRVAGCIRDVGSPPLDMRPEGALAELLSTKDLYSQEPANLARYQADRLRVCKGDVRLKPAEDLLPPEAVAQVHLPSHNGKASNYTANVPLVHVEDDSDEDVFRFGGSLDEFPQQLTPIAVSTQLTGASPVDGVVTCDGVPATDQAALEEANFGRVIGQGWRPFLNIPCAASRGGPKCRPSTDPQEP